MAAEITRPTSDTPRIAEWLLRRVQDFGTDTGQNLMGSAMADAALTRLEVDRLNLLARETS